MCQFCRLLLNSKNDGDFAVMDLPNVVSMDGTAHKVELLNKST